MLSSLKLKFVYILYQDIPIPVFHFFNLFLLLKYSRLLALHSLQNHGLLTFFSIFLLELTLNILYVDIPATIAGFISTLFIPTHKSSIST